MRAGSQVDLAAHPIRHASDDDIGRLVDGWMSTVPDDHKFTIAPDWVCEVASKSTEKFDRYKKLPIYARAGIGHAWLIHPGHRTLEVFRMTAGKWMLVDVCADAETVRAEPFDAIELDLAGEAPY